MPQPPSRPSFSSFNDRALIATLVIISLALGGRIIWDYYWPATFLVDITNQPIGRDFINIWIGPKLAFGDQPAILFDQRAYHHAMQGLFGAAIEFHNWVYPPVVLPFYWPFAQLPYLVALATWTLLFLGIYLWFTTRMIAPDQRLIAGLMLAIAPATVINVIGGQNGFVTASLLLGGIILLDRRPVLAGVLFGLLVFKPQMGLCLPFVLITLGAWRTIAAATVTAAGLLAVSLLLFGFEPWVAFLDLVPPLQRAVMAGFKGFYVYMMTSVTSGARALGIPLQTAILIQAGVSLTVLVLTVLSVRRTQDGAERAFLIAAATPLISPYAFNYDLSALTATIVWVWAGRLTLAWAPANFILILAWVVPLLTMFKPFHLMAIAPFTLVAVFACVVHQIWSAHRDDPSGSTPGAGGIAHKHAREPASMPA